MALRTRFALALAALLCLVAAPPLDARAPKVFLTTDEALELAFPECEVTRETVYLTKEQKKRAEKLAGKELESSLVYLYTATKDGKLVGHAFFDTHKVRTKRETVMIAVDPKARVARIEVLAFAEPEEYLPRGNWYAQFLGKELNDKLRIKRDIRGVAGATMTANVTTEAVRRTLALHRVITETSGAAANG